MRILLVNPPYQTLTSNLGTGHQVPLGLLMVGGPLLDAGHDVRLLDAEARHLSTARIVDEVRRFEADLVMTAHAGSTPAHPVATRVLAAVKRACPHAITVYGGVYPTYHAREILAEEPAVELVVRGEGEATALELVEALAAGGRRRLEEVAGLALRRPLDGRPELTPTRPPIADLDAWRTGWELIDDWDRYTCFGLGRAAIVQFSRGCPHLCSYCGQRGFWVRWRHRDPVRFVDEIERLCREHDVRFLTIADENPTTLESEWRSVLEELVARQLPVHFFATIRATDIVRDAEILDLYRRAGILYVLLGVESTDDRVLRQVRKGSTTRDDFRACRLLKEAGIYSVIGHIVGLGDESRDSFRRASRVLAAYDGDYLNAMHATPHSWTRFADEQRGRAIVEPDQRFWDYRHQVLAEPRLTPWQLFLAVKWLELRFHLRPRRLWRLLARADGFGRRQALWCHLHTGAVWLGEILEFFWRRVRLAALSPSTLPARTTATLRSE